MAFALLYYIVLYHEDSHTLQCHNLNNANYPTAERTSVMGGVSEAARVAAASFGFKQMSGFASVAATYRKRELKPYCLVCPYEAPMQSVCLLQASTEQRDAQCLSPAPLKETLITPA